MAILNFGKKESGEDKKAVKTEQKLPRTKKAPKGSTAITGISSADKKTTSTVAPFILRAPIVSEKSAKGNEIGQYTFEVDGNTNKIQIKDAVEAKYGVAVLGVRVVTIPGKFIQVRRRKGWRSGYKKAIVALGKDQKIEQV